MIATEGLGENQPAHGFLFIVGNSTELLAPDPDLSFAETESSVHSKYGFFPKDLDRRDGWILIQNCTNSDVEKRVLQTLCACHNAIVIDGKSGQVCCGGFANRDSMTPYGTGSRTRAASSIAVRANCVTIKASEDICGTRANPVPPDAHFEVFRGDYYPERVPVVKENEPPSLESQLRPLSFKGELEWHIKQFVPGTRDWILDFLISWVRNPNGPRCCVLLAGPGFGKTAIVAQLYSLLGEDVLIAVHLIRYNNAGKRDPCRMIKSLAYQIAQVLPEYRKNVEEVLRAGSCDLNDIVQLVDCLTLEPLASIERPAGGRLLIVIDALDEAEHATKNHLLDLIAREFPKLPPWVAVLVTSRPELTVQTKLATLRPKFLDSEENAKECDVDVRRFLRAILAPVVDPERLEATITTAAAKAEGLFLYLYWLRKRLEDEPHADIEEIPDGLAGTYLAEFTRVFPGGFSIDCRKVLGAILAASEPLRIKDIPGLSGVSRCEDIVWMLSQLFPARNDACIRVLNESLAGWLMGEFPFENRSDVDPYFIDYVTSHRRAAAACLATLVRELDGPRNLNNESDAHAAAVIRASLTGIGDDDHELLAPVDYALRWAVTHLVAAKLQHVALALLCSLRFVTLRVEAGQMADLVVDSTKVPGGEASLLHQALFLSQNRVRVFGCAVLAEELWQRTLEAAGHGATMMALSRLARDAEQTARATPPFKLTCVLEGHGGGVCGVAGFETRESEPRLASCSLDGTVRVWDPKVGREILKLEGHQSSVRGVVVFKTSDGTRLLLASCSNDCTVHVWDPVECRQLRILDGHEDEVNCVTAFEMKDATCLASCSSDGTINVWDPVAGQQIRKLEDQEGSVLSVVALKLSDENICLASCSSDGTVRVRDATTEARQIRVLEGHEGKATGSCCWQAVLETEQCAFGLLVMPCYFAYFLPTMLQSWVW
ncbi:hypothetical protein CTAYLR_009168 [Chrysophaeum taylorii]|uniref:Nephrocystin 3-like N-terminal domain-containing protein n=1 Tax=Chrysophaeum taylorii TaxID=2483200 RepID=A0AAD7UJP6_9STRA|nr:hypothetical protein CTAYLR_009168 [Chrysophaeum taylorii]